MYFIQDTRKYQASTFVRQTLLASEDLSQMVAGKVFPVIAPLETDGDHIEVLRKDYRRTGDKSGVVENVCVVSIVVWSRDYDRSIQIVEQADALLQGKHDASQTLGRNVIVDVVGSSEGFTDDKYFQELEIEIK